MIYLDMEFLQLFLPDGVWAVLSVALIFYILKAQEKRDVQQAEREQNYQQVITNLTVAAKGIDEIKKTLTDHLT